MNTRSTSHSINYLTIERAARRVGVSASTLRVWERMGLIAPARTKGNFRLYSHQDLRLLKRIKYLRGVEQINAGGILRVLKRERQLPAPQQNQTTSSLGPRLRQIRIKQKLTLSEVAKQAGLSVGFLSLFERSHANASISTIKKLAGVYGASVLSLFRGRRAPRRIVRPEDRLILQPQPGVRMELLAMGGAALEPYLVRVSAGASSGGGYHHEGEEFIYVIRGNLRLWLDESEEYRLGEGDSLHFESSRSHRWMNPGKMETVLLWINTP